jgi:hypothetical protein
MAEKRSIPDNRDPDSDTAGVGVPAPGRPGSEPGGAAAGSDAGGPRPGSRSRPVRSPSPQDPRQPQRPGAAGGAARGSRARTAASAEGRGVARRVGNLSFLGPALAPPATPLATCLEALQRDWVRQEHLAALWQAWPRLAGPQLAPHCRPLALRSCLAPCGAQASPSATCASASTTPRNPPPQALRRRRRCGPGIRAAAMSTAWRPVLSAAVRRRRGKWPAGAIAASAVGPSWPSRPGESRPGEAQRPVTPMAISPWRRG